MLTSEIKPNPKTKKYYRALVTWKHGFKYDQYLQDYQMKSFRSSLEKLDWIDSMVAEEITEEEYFKKLGMSYESDPSASEAPKKRKKKVVKDV